jgi:hypothetical protein
MLLARATARSLALVVLALACGIAAIWVVKGDRQVHASIGDVGGLPAGLTVRAHDDGVVAPGAGTEHVPGVYVIRGAGGARATLDALVGHFVASGAHPTSSFAPFAWSGIIDNDSILVGLGSDLRTADPPGDGELNTDLATSLDADDVVVIVER